MQNMEEIQRNKVDTDEGIGNHELLSDSAIDFMQNHQNSGCSGRRPEAKLDWKRAIGASLIISIFLVVMLLM